MLRVVVPAAAILYALAASPALSQPTEPQQFEEPFVRIDARILSADDFALLRQLSQGMRSESNAQRVAMLEGLARDPQRTAMQKIIIRSFQASLAFARNDPNGAVNIARGTVALFPGEHAAHGSLADIAFRASRFDVAAEGLIGAIERDRSLSDRISAYDQTFLFDRLKELGREDLALTLARRLFDAGWTSGSLGLRSAQAGELVDDLLQKGDLAGAQRYAREIRSPQQIADILSAHHFRPLQQSIEEWAGARLEKQWTSYLNEAHARFTTAATAMSAWEYGGALALAEHNRAIVDQILPLARASFAWSKDETWLFPLSNSATALAKLGRWDEAVRVLEDASRIAPDLGRAVRAGCGNAGHGGGDGADGESRPDGLGDRAQHAGMGNRPFAKGADLGLHHLVAVPDFLAALRNLEETLGFSGNRDRHCCSCAQQSHPGARLVALRLSAAHMDRL